MIGNAVAAKVRLRTVKDGEESDAGGAEAEALEVDQNEGGGESFNEDERFEEARRETEADVTAQGGDELSSEDEALEESNKEIAVLTQIDGA